MTLEELAFELHLVQGYIRRKHAKLKKNIVKFLGWF